MDDDESHKFKPVYRFMSLKAIIAVVIVFIFAIYGLVSAIILALYKFVFKWN